MSTSAGHLDVGILATYLETHVEGFRGPLRAEKFPGGQSNPTFRIESPSGTYVLRRQPAGKLLRSAHAVDREYRVLRALAGTPVPVPKVFHLCEDPDVIGSMFYLMEYLDGHLYWDAALPELDKAQRGNVYQEMLRVLADLHSIDVDAVGLADYGRPGNYFQRQFERWNKQYRSAETHRIAPMEELISVLEQTLPEDDGRIALVHGDYRLDNLMFSPDSSRAIALLDWELSTLGHPYADLGYLCMQMRMPQGVGNISGLQGKNLEALGIPSEQECIARYCARLGIGAIDNFGFYIAFSCFRLAAIIQGVSHRAQQGNASSTHAGSLGQFVGPMAELALDALNNG